MSYQISAPQNSYADGFNIYLKNDLTYNELEKICKDLTNVFNKIYKTKEYSFNLGGKPETGIMWTNWPGKIKHQEKLLKIYNNKGGFDPNYDKKDIFHSCTTIALSTQLRTSDGAPLWTQEEMNLFIKCFGHLGKKRICDKKVKNVIF